MSNTVTAALSVRSRPMKASTRPLIYVPGHAAGATRRSPPMVLLNLTENAIKLRVRDLQPRHVGGKVFCAADGWPLRRGDATVRAERPGRLQTAVEIVEADDLHGDQPASALIVLVMRHRGERRPGKRLRRCRSSGL
jgi:hypothetical protein